MSARAEQRVGGAWPAVRVLATLMAMGATVAVAANFYEPSPQLPIVDYSTAYAVAGDLDGDGDVDAVVGKSSYPDPNTRVLFNDGSGRLFDSGQLLGGIHCPIALGDLDGDHDLDLVITDPTVRVWWNDGAGGFAPGPDLGAIYCYDIVLADVDGDGDLDIMVALSFTGDRLFFNRGGGAFEGPVTPWPGIGGRIALGDLNGDHKLDAVVGTIGILQTPLPDLVYLGDGAGGFTDTGQALGNAVTSALALGDIDGDHDLDLIVGEWLGRNYVWLNNGDATFSSSGETPGQSAHTSDLLLTDVDLDHDLDLVILNEATWTPGTGTGDPAANEVWLNSGAGTFQLGQLLAPAESMQVALGDLNADGVGDLVVANHQLQGLGVRVWFNCLGIFADGFESGGTAGWSDLLP